MKPFLNEAFLLNNKTAEQLYHEYAKPMPIIDYHNHLSPKEIACNQQYQNLTQVWLNGDHYKWRAMRTYGINEDFITGHKSDFEKFMKWAETVPYTLRNPLYHWTHLELQRYFGINELLSPATATAIFKKTAELLSQPDYAVKKLIERMNVKVLCTTDDPTDSLVFHQEIRKSNWKVKVFPAFRPDKSMAVENVASFNQYVNLLEKTTNRSIHQFQDFLEALKQRHSFFAENGCSISDHGLEEMYAEEFTEQKLNHLFNQLRSGKEIAHQQIKVFKSGMLYFFAEWNYEQQFVQQFHLGALRNNNTRKLQTLGADTGWDSIGDFAQAKALAKFLNKLDQQNKLAKTIIYNLNPADNEVFATMIGNFNDGSFAGKIQWGAAWWFLDQKQGIINHFNALSNMGLISKFIGMLTDSRSFLSFPRHEYFRRIVCNLFGEEIEAGELPNDTKLIGSIIQDICYNNAAAYFNGFKN